ncbi:MULTISPECIES: SDR family oxidoreductase [unclassified Caballeronia]|uniref:SDR family oxidoreductase n=1 Tax=unclassified Caballeronia TaxID=2646786 RepID=UPI0028637566|nr:MULTISPECIES: SDR family oxidoreductase [unclassified Caballeronia]MDR5737987.1 SDR family oxidoreductase [Caballeronia sp. LZ016]MDR5809463.1 SDR family oxidoreductase [Caballeronia sp. LZ019]
MSKVILITGASRGIGRSAAVLAGARGWSVGVNYATNARAADETVAAVQAAGGKAIAIQGDVCDEAAILAMFDATEEAFGKLDGVVNNAGIVAPGSALADMDVARLKRIFDTNVLGAYLCAREAARRLSRSRGGKGGALVNVSSAAARLGAPNEYIDYAGSKGAIDVLTIGLSKELGPQGVRVNAIRPGLIETDIHASGGKPDRAQVLGVQTPLGRPGTADEVGESIVWLLSDASSYVTGAILDVTGGR